MTSEELRNCLFECNTNLIKNVVQKIYKDYKKYPERFINNVELLENAYDVSISDKINGNQKGLLVQCIMVYKNMYSYRYKDIFKRDVSEYNIEEFLGFVLSTEEYS